MHGQTNKQAEGNEDISHYKNISQPTLADIILQSQIITCEFKHRQWEEFEDTKGVIRIRKSLIDVHNLLFLIKTDGFGITVICLKY
jgi:hypothetical protein